MNSYKYGVFAEYVVMTYLMLKGYKLLSTEYINAHTEILVECSKGHKFETKYNALQQGCGCPHCSESKGEKETSHILCELNIEYIKQYR